MRIHENLNQSPIEDMMLIWHRIVLSFVIVVYAALHIGVLHLPSTIGVVALFSEFVPS